jgi:hypothetical protein
VTVIKENAEQLPAIVADAQGPKLDAIIAELASRPLAELHRNLLQVECAKEEFLTAAAQLLDAQDLLRRAIVLATQYATLPKARCN